MSIRDDLAGLLRRHALSEGCNSQGAIRDVMTELIHISREAGHDPASIFRSALKVASDEEEEETIEERYDRMRQEAIDRNTRAIDRWRRRVNGEADGG